jgi:hypothetical protein
MTHRSDRHRIFSRRLLEAMGLGSIATLALAGAACGGTVVTNGTGMGGEGTSTGTHTGTGAGTTTSTGDGTGAGTTTTTSTGTGTGGVTTFATTTTDVAASSSTGAGGGCGVAIIPPEVAVQGCIAAQNGVCPPLGQTSTEDAVAASLGICAAHGIGSGLCCNVKALIALTCGPQLTPGGTCCYEGVENPDNLCGVTGRPFTADGVARAAPVRARHDWAKSAVPAVAELDPHTRAALAEAWARDARYEHASVASFARLALELLAVGAPPELLRDAQQAMGDEIRHAEHCFALASTYAGSLMGPGPLPFDGALPRASLEDMAAAAVREGCIGETIAALAAAEARDRARDPAVRAALDVIATDEAEHAAMSWRLCAWAYRTGDVSVRAAIAHAFASSLDLPIEEAPEGIDADAFHAHGRLLPSEARESAERALAEVVRPSAAALLASS